MEDTCVSSSNSTSFIQDCSNDQRPGEVNYETCLPDLGKSLISQPHSTSQNDALALSLRHIVRFSWRGLSNGPGYHMIKNMIGHFVFVVYKL